MSIHSKRDFKTGPKPDKDRPMAKAKTPRYDHAPITMRLRNPPNMPEQPGDFYWRIDDRQRRLLVLAVPAPNPKGWLLCEWTIDHPNAGGYRWKWDLDVMKPTLEPSIHWIGIYHGWVQAGKLREA